MSEIDTYFYIPYQIEATKEIQQSETNIKHNFF